MAVGWDGKRAKIDYKATHFPCFITNLFAALTNFSRLMTINSGKFTIKPKYDTFRLFKMIFLAEFERVNRLEIQTGGSL
jgi:hypothetical protein